MSLKNFWSTAGRWLQACKPSKSADYQPQLNDEGLLSNEEESSGPADDDNITQGNQVVVKTVQPTKAESLEKLQAGFDNLIKQLQGINEHLNQQAAQHKDLISRLEQLPELLESFPAVAENQKQITEQMLEQLKSAAAKDQQFIDTVEKIPTETARQTDCLANIDHQLAAAADTDAQIAENFNKFNEALDNLNTNSAGQTDAICQMSKTFATSDRYLKYIISRQNKRFMWIFVTAISVCAAAILILTVIIVYLKQ